MSGISEKARKRYTQDGRIESAYGTTLISVAMTKEYWFGIHIGDGKCVAINPEGKFVQPIPWDKKCFLNATTSICDSDALTSFRHFYSEKLPVAVFVGSDGIDDCFSNNEQLYNLYKTILYSFGTEEFGDAINALKDYLPRLSAKGSGDDVSIAAMLDFDLVPELEMVKEFDREKERARVEENARKEAEKNEAEKRRVELEHAKFQQQNNGRGKVEHKAKFCTECGAKLSERMKFCSECGAKVPVMQAKSEYGAGEKQIQLFPIKRYQNENVTDAVTQQDINIQDNVQSDNLGQDVCEEENVQLSEEKAEELVVAEEKLDISEKSEDVTLATEENEESIQPNMENEVGSSEDEVSGSTEKIIMRENDFENELTTSL